MLSRNKYVNQQLNNKKPTLLSRIYKIHTIHINKVKEPENSSFKLPILNNIKHFIKSTELTSLNNNNETTKSVSNQTKTNISNGRFIPLFKNINRKVYYSKTERTNEIFPIKIKLKSLNNNKLRKSSSVEIIPIKGIPSAWQFHKKLMEQNKISYNRRLKREYKKFRNSTRDKEKVKEMVFEKRENRKSKTGIFGPNNNIMSIIMAKMQRLRLDNEYKGVDEELKELIKDEIIDAQVKLKMKPTMISLKKGKIRPLYIKKLDRYKYLTKMNLIREVNQNAAVPHLVNDGNMMIKLIKNKILKLKYSMINDLIYICLVEDKLSKEEKEKLLQLTKERMDIISKEDLINNKKNLKKIDLENQYQIFISNVKNNIYLNKNWDIIYYQTNKFEIIYNLINKVINGATIIKLLNKKNNIIKIKFGYTNMNIEELVDNAYRTILKSISFVLSNSEKYNGIENILIKTKKSIPFTIYGNINAENINDFNS